MVRILIPGPPGRFPNYEAALALAGAVPVHGAADGEYDGLLLPGGDDVDPSVYGRSNTDSHGVDTARDALELAAAAACFAANKPVLGVCRGAQVLAVAFGGTLLQDIPGHTRAGNGCDMLHPSAATGLIASLCGPAPTVNSSHHQAAAAVPPGCELLQTTPDGIIEAFAHRTLPVLAVQWHPERLCGAFARPGTADGLAVFRWLTARCEEQKKHLHNP